LVTLVSRDLTSHRTFVTIAIAPHLDETGEIKLLIWPTREAKYFHAQGLINIWGDLPVRQ
jgi:hypothetical protein